MYEKHSRLPINKFRRIETGKFKQRYDYQQFLIVDHNEKQNPDFSDFE